MSPFRLALSGLAGLALAATFALPVVADDGDHEGLGERSFSELSREIIIGKKIAPVPLTIKHRDPSSVYLGAYIVEAVAGCNGCHSNNQYTATGNPFNGQPKQVNTACYLNGGQAFGPFVSRDITPDSTGMPAGLTFAAFKNVLRTGNDPEHPGTLLQVMPWDAFQNMTTTDLRAIYDYLSSIPSLPMGGAAPC